MAEYSVPIMPFAELDARIRAGVEQVACEPRDEHQDPFRGLYLTDERALTLAAERPPAAIDERLDSVSVLLGLDLIERAVLAVCAAPELSWHYARLYGYLHDDLTRPLATPRLVARLLAGAEIADEQVLRRLVPEARLRRMGALRVLDEPQLPIADRRLKCADALAEALLTGAAPDPRTSQCETVPVPTLAPAPREALAQLTNALERTDELALAVVGADGPAALAYVLGRPLLLVSVAGLEDPERLADLRLLAALSQSTLALAGLERLAPDPLQALWTTLRGPSERVLVCLPSADDTVVLGREPALTVSIPPAALPERLAAWSALAVDCDVEDVSVKFRLSIAQISHAARVARARAEARADGGSPTPADLDEGARAASRHGLGRLAGRVEAVADWDALVLPSRSLDALHTICAFLRHRDRVLLDWPSGSSTRASPGLTVLFAGESGTGKTMAAGVVARELGLELYRIDLATVVSKYVGETEKNLDRIFAAAEGSNAILLFDEADALFGKRSQVSDAHDRYANVEVAYLLQRIEGYPGAVILTTNLSQNIDESFLRRLDVRVEFPFPQAPERERLWERLLPPGVAREPLRLGSLAERHKLSGGSIRNAALAAAVLAAEQDSPLESEHLRRAIALEYNKLGRLTVGDENLEAARE